MFFNRKSNTTTGLKPIDLAVVNSIGMEMRLKNIYCGVCHTGFGIRKISLLGSVH